MEILGKLFGSPARVKLMRLFLMNPEDMYEKKEAGRRSKVGGATLGREVRLLEEVGLIKPKTTTVLLPARSKKGSAKRKKIYGFTLDVTFPFLVALRSLVTEVALGKEDLSARFRNCGQMKIIVASGVFMDEENSRVDILLVGDKLKKPAIEGILRRLEAELGKELTYGIMETSEFEYRHGIYDKFIRDILDYPHLVVLNKLNLL